MTNLAFVENYSEVRKRLRGAAPTPVDFQYIRRMRMARVWYDKPLRPGAGFEHASAPVRGGLSIYDEPVGPPHLTLSLDRAKFILAGIARISGFSREQIVGRQRNSELVKVRHYAIYLTSNCTTWSLVRIGRFFGGRDHTSTLHAVECVQKLRGEIEETVRGARAARERAKKNPAK